MEHSIRFCIYGILIWWSPIAMLQSGILWLLWSLYFEFSKSMHTLILAITCKGFIWLMVVICCGWFGLIIGLILAVVDINIWCLILLVIRYGLLLTVDRIRFDAIRWLAIIWIFCVSISSYSTVGNSCELLACLKVILGNSFVVWRFNSVFCVFTL